MDLSTGLFVAGCIFIVIALGVIFFRLTKHRDIEETMNWPDNERES